MSVQIGSEFRATRANHGLRLRDICEAVGLSVSMGSWVERGVIGHVDVMLLARCAPSSASI
jgi:transcriptional regulator with XRE-family HTH domain